MDRRSLIQNFFKSTNAMARIGIMQHKRGHGAKKLLPHTQMSVLFVVSQSDQITIKDLAALFSMTPSAGTQLVNELVKRNYLSRIEDKSDRRKIGLALTDQGKKILISAKVHRIKRMQEMFEPLTDKELTQLLKIQKKIVEHWENKSKIK